MRKNLKIAGSFFLVALLLIAVLIVKAIIDQKRYAEDQAAMAKTDEERIGRRFFVERDSKAPVEGKPPEQEAKTREAEKISTAG